MKKNLIMMLTLILCLGAQAKERQPDTHRLWYKKPATHWLEALPLGNSQLGAMEWGGVSEDLISLNDSDLNSVSEFSPSIFKRPIDRFTASAKDEIIW